MLIRTDSATAFYLQQTVSVPTDDFTELQLHQFADDKIVTIFGLLFLLLFRDILGSLQLCF